MPWSCLLLFCAALTATILYTPFVMTLARWLGAVDQPDGFRKHHAGATPRLGGLAVALGLLTAILFAAWFAPGVWSSIQVELRADLVLTVLSLAVVVAAGIEDDRRGLSARVKLLFQILAASGLDAAGSRIEKVFLFGTTLDLGPLAPLATTFWFLGCMNVWNLIDGMDGLASGVGTIVALTVMLAAGALGHVGIAPLAAGLAGALSGFLIFNFHPARAFLGDTGSLFLGAVLGMLAIRGSIKSGMTVAILAPILAMGLPIMDTALAIVRRWMRRVPWSVADHGHLHHRLLRYGMSTPQASLFLYSFTLVLCGAALVSVVVQSDTLAALFAAMGAAGLGAVFLCRREEYRGLMRDLLRRLGHRQREQRATAVVWEAIQRLEKCRSPRELVGTAEQMAARLGCDQFMLIFERDHRLELQRWRDFPVPQDTAPVAPATLQLRWTGGTAAGGRLELHLSQRLVASSCLGLAADSLGRFHEELLCRFQKLADVAASRTADAEADSAATVLARRSVEGAA